MYLHVNENSFSYDRLCTKTDFENEIEDNSEMATLPHSCYTCREPLESRLVSLFSLHMDEKLAAFTPTNATDVWKAPKGEENGESLWRYLIPPPPNPTFPSPLAPATQATVLHIPVPLHVVFYKSSSFWPSEESFNARLSVFISINTP